MTTKQFIIAGLQMTGAVMFIVTAFFLLLAWGQFLLTYLFKHL